MQTNSVQMYISSWLREINVDFHGFLRKMSKRDNSMDIDGSFENWSIYDSATDAELPIGKLITEYSALLTEAQKNQHMANEYDRKFGTSLHQSDVVVELIIKLACDIDAYKTRQFEKLHNVAKFEKMTFSDDMDANPIDISTIDADTTDVDAVNVNDIDSNIGPKNVVTIADGVIVAAERLPSILNGKTLPDLIEIYKHLRAQLNSVLDAWNLELDNVTEQLRYCLDIIPNLLDSSVPDGSSEEDNALVYLRGEQYKNRSSFESLGFQPKHHFEVASRAMDFETAAEISGSRFVFLFNELAKLSRALENFFLDELALHGYIEVSCPQLTKDSALYCVGQLPKMADASFVVDGKYRLIPTAEVPLTNIVRGKTLSCEELPLRFCAATECFRSEVGSASRDIQGMIRMHEFRKVEIVGIVTEEEATNEHERMLNVISSLLDKLELHYRVMLLCSGDTGFAAQKTCDFEVWLPGQNRYREISSCSNFGIFQARRMGARYFDISTKNKAKKYLHTLNGSALAIGRTLIAVLENYQQRDGSVLIPRALRRYYDISIENNKKNDDEIYCFV